MKLKAGTRKSELALKQVEIVFENLIKNNICEIEIVGLDTKGDIDKKSSLADIGGKGVFVRDIEEKLIEGEIDVAVHSLKDMHSYVPEKLALAYFKHREDKRDIIVFNEKHSSSFDLCGAYKVATGSKRRKFQALRINDRLDIRDIRGNIPTRLKKLQDEDLDAIIISAASLIRLNLYDKLKDRILPLDAENFYPAPSQGIIAVEYRKDNKKIEHILPFISSERTDFEALVERKFLSLSGGSCNLPLGCNLQEYKGVYSFKAFMASEDLKSFSYRQIYIDKMNYEKELVSMVNAMKEDIYV